MNPHLVTLIKRADVVLRSGVGSLVRTRHGITGLVAGLHEWEHTLRDALRTDKEVQDFRRQHTIRERELEAATGVHRFLAPPRFAEDRRDNWPIPIIRFPLAGVCDNWKCSQVTCANPFDSGVAAWKCPHCSEGRKFSRIKQVPIFRACAAGHLEEIDWSAAVDHVGGCNSDRIKLSFGDHVTAPRVLCVSCGGKNESPLSSACSGAKPWLPGSANDVCTEKMEILERTSVTVYYPSTKSSLHIPPDQILDEALIEYLISDVVRLRWVGRLNTAAPDSLAEFRETVAELGYVLNDEDAVAHIRYIHDLERTNDDEEWDVLAAREREFDVLSGRLLFPALTKTSLLSFEVKPPTAYSHPLVGPGGLIAGVTAVHVLTETRVLDGFSRIDPRSVSRRDGHLLMWGSDISKESWLPAYRVHGEGIFIELDASRIHQALSGNRPETKNDSQLVFGLSPAGSFAHTLAHMLIRELGNDSGYSIPSIRDRIYDLGGNRLGLLVYTAEGDSMGTMGGVVAFAEPGTFERLLNRVCDAVRWCPQDPVCIEMPLDTSRHIAGACHQCVLLPETSCELFNQYLDRGTLIGSADRGFADVLGQFAGTAREEHQPIEPYGNG